MTPEDVLIESITAASQHGDSVRLRHDQCAKLRASLDRYYLLYPEFDVSLVKHNDKPN